MKNIIILFLLSISALASQGQTSMTFTALFSTTDYIMPGKGPQWWNLSDWDGSTIPTIPSGNKSWADGYRRFALTSGTKAVTITGLTTSSRGFVTLVSQSGTVTTTIQYIAVCTSNTLTISAVTVAGTNTINTSDASTLNYFVIN